MTSRRKIMISHIALALFFCALIGVGTFFDREISAALYAPQSVPVRILTSFGLYVPFAAFVFFSSVLFGQYSVQQGASARRRRTALIITGLLALITGLAGSISLTHYECLGSFDFIARAPSAVKIPLLTVFAMLPVFLWGKAVGNRLGYDRELIRRIIKLLIFILIVTLLMLLGKNVFARPRYRTTLGSGIDFVPWYSVSLGSGRAAAAAGVDKNAFQSFPSGHSISNVAGIFIFPAFAMVIHKLKGKEALLFAAGVVYGLMIMLTRLILGAHFLTDVSFGALIATVVSMIYYRIEVNTRDNDREKPAPVGSRSTENTEK